MGVTSTGRNYTKFMIIKIDGRRHILCALQTSTGARNCYGTICRGSAELNIGFSKMFLQNDQKRK